MHSIINRGLGDSQTEVKSCPRARIRLSCNSKLIWYFHKGHRSYSISSKVLQFMPSYPLCKPETLIWEPTIRICIHRGFSDCLSTVPLTNRTDETATKYVRIETAKPPLQVIRPSTHNYKLGRPMKHIFSVFFSQILTLCSRNGPWNYIIILPLMMPMTLPNDQMKAMNAWQPIEKLCFNYSSKCVFFILFFSNIATFMNQIKVRNGTTMGFQTSTWVFSETLTFKRGDIT